MLVIFQYFAAFEVAGAAAPACSGSSCCCSCIVAAARVSCTQAHKPCQARVLFSFVLTCNGAMAAIHYNTNRTGSTQKVPAEAGNSGSSSDKANRTTQDTASACAVPSKPKTRAADAARSFSDQPPGGGRHLEYGPKGLA